MKSPESMSVPSRSKRTVSKRIRMMLSRQAGAPTLEGADSRAPVRLRRDHRGYRGSRVSRVVRNLRGARSRAPASRLVSGGWHGRGIRPRRASRAAHRTAPRPEVRARRGAPAAPRARRAGGAAPRDRRLRGRSTGASHPDRGRHERHDRVGYRMLDASPWPRGGIPSTLPRATRPSPSHDPTSTSVRSKPSTSSRARRSPSKTRRTEYWAAKAAGILCVAVPNDITRSLELSEADLILESLADVPLTEPSRGSPHAPRLSSRPARGRAPTGEPSSRPPRGPPCSRRAISSGSFSTIVPTSVRTMCLRKLSAAIVSSRTSPDRAQAHALTSRRKTHAGCPWAERPKVVLSEHHSG